MLFTPVDIKTNKRLNMDVHETQIPRGKAGVRFHVIAATTGKRYTCKVTSCGIPNCMCDAAILDYN